MSNQMDQMDDEARGNECVKNNVRSAKITRTSSAPSRADSEEIITKNTMKSQKHHTYLQVSEIEKPIPALITNIMGVILFSRKVLLCWMPILLFVLVVSMSTACPITAHNPLSHLHFPSKMGKNFFGNPSSRIASILAMIIYRGSQICPRRCNIAQEYSKQVSASSYGP